MKTITVHEQEFEVAKRQGYAQQWSVRRQGGKKYQDDKGSEAVLSLRRGPASETQEVGRIGKRRDGAIEITVMSGGSPTGPAGFADDIETATTRAAELLMNWDEGRTALAESIDEWIES